VTNSMDMGSLKIDWEIATQEIGVKGRGKDLHIQKISKEIAM
jgi:hypothetical protein